METPYKALVVALIVTVLFYSIVVGLAIRKTLSQPWTYPQSQVEK